MYAYKFKTLYIDPKDVLHDAFQQYAAEVELVLKEKTWAEVGDTLKKKLFESFPKVPRSERISAC